jgi:hypothetical protein
VIAVTLILPTTLLRRFRTLAEELIPYELDADPFHLLLWCAAAEALLAHASLAPVEEPPATLVPTHTVHSAVPEEAAAFVARLARVSGLTLEQCWHRVVLEFCERSEAPGLGATQEALEAA